MPALRRVFDRLLRERLDLARRQPGGGGRNAQTCHPDGGRDPIRALEQLDRKASLTVLRDTDYGSMLGLVDTILGHQPRIRHLPSRQHAQVAIQASIRCSTSRRRATKAFIMEMATLG